MDNRIQGICPRRNNHTLTNMPLDLFRNTETGAVHEVIYHMNDKKDYRGPTGKDSKGVWARVWTKPLMAIDAVKMDPYSTKDFLRATNKRGTLGDMYDRSAEWSEKRAMKDGTDPIKQKWYANYSKKRKGRKHPQQLREESHKVLESKGIKVDWGEFENGL